MAKRETRHEWGHPGVVCNMAKHEKRLEETILVLLALCPNSKRDVELTILVLLAVWPKRTRDVRGNILALLAIWQQGNETPGGTILGVAGRMATESMTCEVDHFGVAECLANYHYQDVEFHPY